MFAQNSVCSSCVDLAKGPHSRDSQYGFCTSHACALDTAELCIRSAGVVQKTTRLATAGDSPARSDG